MAEHTLLHENPKPLNQLRKALPGSRGAETLHLATLHRWAHRGIRRKDGVVVKLEVIRIGGAVVSSEAAVKRFLDALNEPAGNHPHAAPLPTPSAKKRRDASMNQALGEKLGA